jgi:hypothetical protein
MVAYDAARRCCRSGMVHSLLAVEQASTPSKQRATIQRRSPSLTDELPPRAFRPEPPVRFHFVILLPLSYLQIDQAP